MKVWVRVAALAHYSEGPGRFKDYASKPKPNGYQSVYLAINPLLSRYEGVSRTRRESPTDASRCVLLLRPRIPVSSLGLICAMLVKVHPCIGPQRRVQVSVLRTARVAAPHVPAHDAL
jgi:hypothetical protein